MQLSIESSAHANAWLHALGNDLPEEIIILPEEGPKSLALQRDKSVQWTSDLSMDVFPNPSNGPIMVAYEVPEGTLIAELRLTDIHGRMLKMLRIGEGAGLTQLNMEVLASGVYVADLSLDGVRVAHQKVVVQH